MSDWRTRAYLLQYHYVQPAIAYTRPLIVKTTQLTVDAATFVAKTVVNGIGSLYYAYYCGDEVVKET